MPNLDDTDIGVAADLGLYSAKRERDRNPKDRLTQDLLGPKEHGQAVEEITSENPIKGVAMTVAAPVYTAAKALGLTDARSSASSDEIFSAMEGFGRGVKRYLKR